MGFLSAIVRPLFATVFIGVNLDSTTCTIHVIKKRSRKIVEEISRHFAIVDGELSAEATKYIGKIKSRYAFSYLGIISKTDEQVLIPSSSVKGAKKPPLSDFGVNDKDYNVLKLSSAFVCILKQDIQDYQKAFKKAKGLDYIFSPFVILFFKAKTFISDTPKLFALQEKETLCIFIATRKEILYGAFLYMSDADKMENAPTSSIIHNNTEEEDTLVASNVATERGIDDLNTELSGLDEELADLDSFDFNSIGVESNEENISGESADDSGSGDMDRFQDLGRSTGIINLLHASIKDFYHNSLYNSDFIEEIVFFDCYGISAQAVDNIRSSVMIDMSVQQVDLAKEIVGIAQIELDS